jgi:hypothetical protein
VDKKTARWMALAPAPANERAEMARDVQRRTTAADDVRNALISNFKIE